MKREKINTAILFSLLLLLSFAFRIFRLNQGLWYDEIVTVLKFVRLPWIQIVTSLPLPNNHILYSLLAKFCVQIFGEKEWSLRLPSLILGGLTPGVSYWVLRKKFAELGAFLTGLFLALSFWMVWFAQDARGYAGMILFTLLSQIFFLEWAEGQKRQTLIGYLLSSIVALAFHLYSAFLILAQIAYGFFQWLKARRTTKARIFLIPLLSLFLSSLLYLPGAMELINYIGKEGQDITGRWLDLNLLKETIKLFVGSHFLIIGIFFWALALLGLTQVWKKLPQLCVLYLLSALFLILFTLILRVFIYARFLAFMIPFFYLCLAYGILELDKLLSLGIFKKGISQLVLAGLIIVFLLISLNRYYHLGKQGLKLAGEYIKENYPSAEVISLGLARREFLYYYPKAWPVYGQVPLPPAQVLGKLVVASHPWSWAPHNLKTLNQFCQLEKVWESAGYEENVVYLYNCLNHKLGNGTR